MKAMSPDSIRKSSRRAFLTTAIGGLLAGCGWNGGSDFLWPRLVSFSRVNDWLGARLFSANRRAAKYAEDRRTAEFPAYYVSSTTPSLSDPVSWRLELGGLVERPTTLSLEEIRALAELRYTVKHHCVEGWSAIGTWRGTPMQTIAELVAVRPEARFIRFDSFDSGYYNGWDIASALHPETILAYEFNDAPLSPEYGAPLRLYAPHKLGYKLTKYLTRITFTDERPGGYWEDQGYPWFGGI